MSNYQSFSPSPSPAPQPASPPHLYSPQSAANQQYQQQNGIPQQQQGPGRGYSLINKIQQHHYPVGPHHQQPQHYHAYPGPPSSPAAYSNAPSHLQSHPSHHSPAPIGPPPLQHSSHHPHQPPPPHHLSMGSNNQGSGQQGQQGGGNSHPSQLGQQNGLGGGGPLLGNNMSGGGGGGGQGGLGGSVPNTPHWQQQLSFASISRQSNSPHHHARAAHLAARGQTSSAVPITEPTTFGTPAPNHRPATISKPNGILGHRNTDSTGGTSFIARPQSVGPDVDRSSSVASTRTTVSSSAHAKENSSTNTTMTTTSPTPIAAGVSNVDTSNVGNSWTTIDMGGMNLKNISPALFRYTFLTVLYIPHNALHHLPSSISRLAHLTLLDASSNKLTTLPPELGLLTRLRDLFLFDNHLSSLPPELGTLHLLDTLGIEGNPLPENMRSLLEKDGTSALIAYLRDSCPVPLPPPEREWVSIEADNFPLNGLEGKPEEINFSLLCYNILCEKYATSQMYGYTPSWALSWDYRKELILQELLNYSSDILCLQEVDTEQYEEYFLEHLSQQDYEGVHYPKSRARTMSGEEKRHVDGCATFYKSTTFALIETHLIEFNQIALRRPDFKKTEDMFNRVMTKDHIAVVTLLEHRASGARLIVANAHIHWDPEFRDVKLVQVAMLMDELAKIGNDFAKLPARLHLAEGYDKAPSYTNGTKIPTIICGDFNSVPDSGVYEFLSRGHVEKGHPDFMNHIYGNYTSEGLDHRLGLRSAYSHIGELPFTNYTPGFAGVIDYIWYTTGSLGVVGLLGEVDREYLAKQVGFPNAHTPSDHISLYGLFSVRQ